MGFVAKLSFPEFLKNIYYYSHETREKTRKSIFVLVQFSDFCGQQYLISGARISVIINDYSHETHERTRKSIFVLV